MATSNDPFSILSPSETLIRGVLCSKSVILPVIHAVRDAAGGLELELSATDERPLEVEYWPDLAVDDAVIFLDYDGEAFRAEEVTLFGEEMKEHTGDRPRTPAGPALAFTLKQIAKMAENIEDDPADTLLAIRDLVGEVLGLEPFTPQDPEERQADHAADTLEQLKNREQQLERMRDKMNRLLSLVEIVIPVADKPLSLSLQNALREFVGLPPASEEKSAEPKAAESG